MAALSESLMKMAGDTVPTNELYERSLKDFLPLLTKILGKKPDISDLGSTPPATTAFLVRQAREFAYKGLFFISGSTSWKEIVSTAGADAAKGVIAVLYVDPASSACQHDVTEFRKTVCQEPDKALAPYTNGVNILIHAIQKSGAVDDTSRVAAVPAAEGSGDNRVSGA